MKLSNKDKKEITIWLGALRSGLFKQTTGKLQDYQGYCCLGVACELFVNDKKKILFENELEGGLPSQQIKNNEYWLNRISEERFKYGNDEYRLVDLNDNKGLSFKQIANIIEKKLLKD